MKSLVHTSVICMTLITLVFGATSLHPNAGNDHNNDKSV